MSNLTYSIIGGVEVGAQQKHMIQVRKLPLLSATKLYFAAKMQVLRNIMHRTAQELREGTDRQSLQI